MKRTKLREKDDNPNFRGTMRFGIERFAQSLIDNHADSARQLRLV